MISGVQVFALKKIDDDRGSVMHMLKKTDSHFEGFGEIYFSLTLAGIVKAWKRHNRITQFFAVPVGNLLLVLFDPREDSLTKGMVQQVHLGEDNYQLIRIPAGIWYGFRAEGNSYSLIANCATDPHDPMESDKAPIECEFIPYNWANAV